MCSGLQGPPWCSPAWEKNTAGALGGPPCLVRLPQDPAHTFWGWKCAWGQVREAEPGSLALLPSHPHLKGICKELWTRLQDLPLPEILERH